MQTKYSTTFSNAVNKIRLPLLALSLLSFAAANYYFFVYMIIHGESGFGDTLDAVILGVLTLCAIVCFVAVGFGRLYAKDYNIFIYALIAIPYIILSAFGVVSFLNDIQLVTSTTAMQKSFAIALAALVAIEFVVAKGGDNG